MVKLKPYPERRIEIIKLKPCPVCGKYAVVCRIREINKDYCTIYRVECSEGCISTDNVDSKELAIKLWNDWVDEYERSQA